MAQGREKRGSTCGLMQIKKVSGPTALWPLQGSVPHPLKGWRGSTSLLRWSLRKPRQQKSLDSKQKKRERGWR